MTAVEWIAAPPRPRARLCLGVTGHRESHPGFAAHRARVETTLKAVLDHIAASASAAPPPFGEPMAPLRLHSMLADGADQMAAEAALARGWELVSPLPFGAALNRAVNSRPRSVEDAAAALAGSRPSDDAVAARAAAITRLYTQSRLFELADDDAELTAALLGALAGPADTELRDAFEADASARVAQAARIVIEQSDLLIAVWDGARTSFVGGTGHTVAQALALGAAVIWIDPAEPEAWRILRAPEALASLRTLSPDPARDDLLHRLVEAALAPRALVAAGDEPGVEALDAKHWRPRSTVLWHAYRRVEAVFGAEKGRNPWRSLRQTYDTPTTHAEGQGAPVLAATASLTPQDPAFASRIKADVMARFAWADAISSRLSDTYRGGMMMNFALSACAIIGGVAYLPLTGGALKWPFAGFELVLLSAILAITFYGQKRRWHGRWFETRRVAEYLRHAPLLLALGAARSPGRWPQGAETSWPEHYARHALREAGLPRATVTPAYLRQALRDLLAPHVRAQRDYHHAKAKRLARAHHNLDRLSEGMFQVAVAAVLVYLAIVLAGEAHLVKEKAVASAGKLFTFLGVALPTLGGAIAGIRYFGDFERFAAISEVTAGKLDAVHERIEILLAADDAGLDYGPVADLAHAADDIVVSEIENWQAVFAGKHISVPV